jgi:hypothetical protein
MTTKRKIWLIGYAVVLVLSAILGGGIFAAIPILVLFGFIELIRLFFVSLKRSKQKMADIKANTAKIAEQKAAVEEALITTGLPPQNTPSEFVFTAGLLLNPILLITFAVTAGPSVTDQQNRVKKARTERGITLSAEAYAASEAYFDNKRAEASKFILPAILAGIVCFIIIAVILSFVFRLLNSISV